MHCPFCRNNDTKVKDSRLGADGMEVRRRRQCFECKKRFTTYEKSERSYPRVIKRDGRIENFDPNKIRRGLQRSVEKRSVSTSSIEAIVDKVCDSLSRVREDQIKSATIGDMSLKELGGIDDVAYVRFASVYRQFDSICDFTSELEKLSKRSDS